MKKQNDGKQINERTHISQDILDMLDDATNKIGNEFQIQKNQENYEVLKGQMAPNKTNQQIKNMYLQNSQSQTSNQNNNQKPRNLKFLDKQKQDKNCFQDEKQKLNNHANLQKDRFQQFDKNQNQIKRQKLDDQKIKAGHNSENKENYLINSNQQMMKISAISQNSNDIQHGEVNSDTKPHQPVSNLSSQAQLKENSVESQINSHAAHLEVVEQVQQQQILSDDLKYQLRHQSCLDDGTIEMFEEMVRQGTMTLEEVKNNLQPYPNINNEQENQNSIEVMKDFDQNNEQMSRQQSQNIDQEEKQVGRQKEFKIDQKQISKEKIEQFKNQHLCFENKINIIDQKRQSQIDQNQSFSQIFYAQPKISNYQPLYNQQLENNDKYIQEEEMQMLQPIDKMQVDQENVELPIMSQDYDNSPQQQQKIFDSIQSNNLQSHNNQILKLELQKQEQIDQDYLYAYLFDKYGSDQEIDFKAEIDKYQSIQNKERLYHEIKTQMEDQIYDIKVPTSSKDKQFVSSLLYAKKIIEACKNQSQYMDITNLVILDNQMRICPVAKATNNNNNYSDDENEDDKNIDKEILHQQQFDSAYREKNIKIALRAAPYKVYFPQPYSDREYTQIYEKNKSFNELYIQNYKQLGNNEYQQQSLHLAIKQYRDIALQNEELYYQNKGQPSKNLQQLINCIEESIEAQKPKKSIILAFRPEEKVRFYVNDILKFVKKHCGQDIHIDQEKPISIFGKKKQLKSPQLYLQRQNISGEIQMQKYYSSSWDKSACFKPDFTLTLDKGDDDEEAICLIEVKKLFEKLKSKQKENEQNIIREGKEDWQVLDIKENLIQQIKQLRTYCIQEKKDHIIGVITNGKDWIFTRYDLKAEIEKNLQNYMSKEEKEQREKKKREQPGLREKHVFEHSGKYQIFQIDHVNKKVNFNAKELTRVIYIISKLNLYYAGIMDL